MGNDGGSIPGRAELVRSKPKEVRVESDLVAKFRAKFCALTKDRLRKPVVSCRLGYLFNYESLLKNFLNKTLPPQFKHIQKVEKILKIHQKIKQVRELNIQDNPDNTSEFPFVCPISQITMNGKNKFLALWSCGCAFHEQVIKDLGIKDSKCPVCQTPYTQEDIVPLCLTNEEAEFKRAQLLQSQKLEQKRRRSKLEDVIEKKTCTEEKKDRIQENRLEKIANNKESGPAPQMVMNKLEKLQQHEDRVQNSSGNNIQ